MNKNLDIYMKNKLLELLTARCRDMGLTSKAIEELANLGSAGLAEDATDEDVASKVDSLIPFAASYMKYRMFKIYFH